jgi:hypothetical protein
MSKVEQVPREIANRCRAAPLRGAACHEAYSP